MEAREESKRCRAYIITWNNYTADDLKYWKEYIEANCEKCTWQEEKGENGTIHIQGALYFKSGRTFKAVKKELPKCHIEAAKSWGAIKNYCKKLDTRAGEGGEIDQAHPRFPFAIKDKLMEVEMKPFQKSIIDLISTEPDDRSIYWIWEKTGNVGKTTLARHICIKDPKAIYLTGKASDMKYAVAQVVLKNHIDLRLCILDFTRTVEKFTGSMWQGIEEIKNGIFFSGKFESGMVIFNHPHIICLANWRPPDKGVFSLDRWKIYEIVDDELEECL